MAETEIPLDTWPRKDHFALFKTYAKPHFAITSRLDVTHLLTNRKNLNAYRACLYAIGAGLHAVPELCTRFRGDTIIQHDRIALSMTVPRDDGSIGFGYLAFDPDQDIFDAQAKAELDAAKTRPVAPNTGQRDDLAYLSCLPWLDYTSLDNALAGPEDCIPRISWGKFAQCANGWSMAMTAEVHHAVVDGAHVAAYFAATQKALNGV